MNYKLNADQRARAIDLVEQIINDPESFAFEIIWLRDNRRYSDQATEKKDEPPVICVGLETLAVLFQGGNVNLGGAVLIPDSNVSNAACYALNVCSPAMRDSQNSQDRLEEIAAIAHLKRTTPRHTEYTLTPNRVEEMLATTIPGGSVSDPQEIADAIREWFGYSYDDLEEID